MPRYPKGVVSRFPADFNLTNMYATSENISGPGPGFITLGALLYNNLQNGNIIVWDFEIASQLNTATANSYVNTVVGFQRGHGPPNHFIDGPNPAAYNMGVIGATGLGATYGVVTGGFYPSNYGNQVQIANMTGSLLAVRYRWNRPFPFAQLAPGDGLIIFTASSTNTNLQGTGSGTTVAYFYEAGDSSTYP